MTEELLGLDETEKATLHHLAEAWNSFIELDSLHPDDREDFKIAIHQAQRIIMSRPIMKQLKRT